MSDPIRAALAEAQRHAVGVGGEPIPAGPIIAAFLRAIPNWAPVPSRDRGKPWHWRESAGADLAAAVEKAAADE